ncbi:MAG: DUF4347 domain-containing protein [Magnetococcales bacterium]|nr:DUF4347 domain-containing protein [Magnetococcales bacterium]
MFWFDKNSSNSLNKQGNFTSSSHTPPRPIISPPYMGRKFQLDPLLLEPRLLFDGAALDTAIDSVTETSLDTDVQNSEIDNQALFSALAQTHDDSQGRDQPKEIIFIAADVDDIETLLAGIDPTHEVKLLDGNSDGVLQIAETLAEYHNLDAIHIISHGDDGLVALGNSELSNSNISTYTQALTQWGDALTTGGDILFYGCDVGAGDAGAEFVEQLSQLTGADIAASDDLTGSQGGDWSLEKISGNVETEVALTITSQENYAGTLATITVTSTADNSTSDGLVTLREAITAAQTDASVDGSTAGSGADTIVFSVTANSTIQLTSVLTISSDITIDGDFDGSGDNVADISISDDGATSTRGFFISAGTVNFNSLTLDDIDYTSGSGGAIVHTGGTLTIYNSTIKNSSASSSGGGIWSSSTLNITNSTISTNSATSNGGNIYSTGTLNITDSTVSGGVATGWGGGLMSYGTVNITRSTFSTNQATSNVGGIYNNSVLNIIDSTISGNFTNGNAGGIYVSAGTTTIEHSTIAFNVADMNDSGSTGGGIYNSAGTANLGHTIVSNNYQDSASSVSSDLVGTFGSSGDSAGYNLLNDVAAATIGGTTTGNISTDPNLQALANNGGTTQTHALLAGSAAVNAGNASITNEPTYDQRSTGYSRKVGTIDIGAFERVAPTDISAASWSTTSGLLYIGDSVNLTVTASDTGLKAGTVTINSVDVSSTMVDNGNNTYTFTYTVADGNTDIADSSTIPISVTLAESNGNTTSAYTSVAAGSSPGVDGNSPIISSPSWSVTSGTLGVGDSVKLTVTATETGLSAGTATINSVDVSGTMVDNGDNTYTFTYTVASGNTSIATSATIPISITLTDSDGNSSVTYTTTPVAASSPAINGSVTTTTKTTTTTTTTDTTTTDPVTTDTTTTVPVTTDPVTTDSVTTDPVTTVPTEVVALDSETAQQVDNLLAEVASGKNIQRSDLIKVMRESGADNESMKAALAEFETVRKAMRTELFKDAIAELDKLKFVLPKLFPEWFPELTSKKIALFISINDYQGLIPDLNTPNHDVDVISGVLEKRGFQNIVLKDATYQKVMEAFRGIADKIQPGQDLVIYYAGHGYQREDNGSAYWIMGDADSKSSKKWISTKQISDFLSTVQANNTLLISDSCYSGSLTKESAVAATSDDSTYDGKKTSRSVVTMSSGGEEPVSDGGSDGHSIFAYNLIKTLEKNQDDISGQEIFSKVRDGVTKLFPQTPQYGAVLSAGHEVGGDFVFTKHSSTAQ